MNILANIYTVSQVRREMNAIADEIQDCNQVINAVLQELESESYGRFVDDLKEATCALIDFASKLVTALVSGIAAIGNVAEKLTTADVDGASSLSASKFGGKR